MVVPATAGAGAGALIAVKYLFANANQRWCVHRAVRCTSRQCGVGWGNVVPRVFFVCTSNSEPRSLVHIRTDTHTHSTSERWIHLPVTTANIGVGKMELIIPPAIVRYVAGAGTSADDDDEEENEGIALVWSPLLSTTAVSSLVVAADVNGPATAAAAAASDGGASAAVDVVEVVSCTSMIDDSDDT